MSSESKTRKQKIKRILSFLSAILVIMCILSTFVVHAASYTADWRNWCQGASDSSLMRKYGCWVVAQAKMIKMLNIDDSASFNPDYYMDWEIRNGYLNSRTFMQQNGVNAPVAYAAQKGKTLNYIGYKTGKDNIWNNINNGYYSILYFTTPSGGTHNVLVDNETSKQKNAIYFFQSYDGATYGPIKSYDEYVKTGRALQGIYTYSYSVHRHSHTYNYEAKHPHKVYMKCSCGDWYYTGETTKMDGCDLCYPIVHITLDANGGENGTREFYYRTNKSSYYSDVKLSNQITSIELPTREGYTFVAYGKYIFGCFRFDDMPDDYCSGDILPNLSQEINADTTLSAVWAVNCYELSYDLNGGFVSKENPTDYSIESEDFTLINPTKKGYQFIGWQENDSSVTKATVTITKGSTGDRSFKAIYHMLGDINGDGEVNTSDLVRLMKYMAGADVIAYYPDVNGDDIVATSDLIRLMKYISGADVTLYLSAPEAI